MTILAWTKCRLVTKHVLSFVTHYHTFPSKFYLYKKTSIKDYVLLLYTIMIIILPCKFYLYKKTSIKDYVLLLYTIIFMIIILSFKVTKSAFLVRSWEWRGIGTDRPELSLILFFILRDMAEQQWRITQNMTPKSLFKWLM